MIILVTTIPVVTAVSYTVLQVYKLYVEKEKSRYRDRYRWVYTYWYLHIQTIIIEKILQFVRTTRQFTILIREH